MENEKTITVLEQHMKKLKLKSFENIFCAENTKQLKMLTCERKRTLGEKIDMFVN